MIYFFPQLFIVLWVVACLYWKKYILIEIGENQDVVFFPLKFVFPRLRIWDSKHLIRCYPICKAVTFGYLFLTTSTKSSFNFVQCYQRHTFWNLVNIDEIGKTRYFECRRHNFLNKLSGVSSAKLYCVRFHVTQVTEY